MLLHVYVRTVHIFRRCAVLYSVVYVPLYRSALSDLQTEQKKALEEHLASVRQQIEVSGFNVQLLCSCVIVVHLSPAEVPRERAQEQGG